MSPSPSIENGRAESAVGNKSCKQQVRFPGKVVMNSLSRYTLIVQINYT